MVRSIFTALALTACVPAQLVRIEAPALVDSRLQRMVLHDDRARSIAPVGQPEQVISNDVIELVSLRAARAGLVQVGSTNRVELRLLDWWWAFAEAPWGTFSSALVVRSRLELTVFDDSNQVIRRTTGAASNTVDGWGFPSKARIASELLASLDLSIAQLLYKAGR